MKAIILLGTLKKTGQSNTEVLCKFFIKKLAGKNIDSEIIKLVDYKILPGTYSDMGGGDEWPTILDKIIAADIIIFATPVWWGSHSSEMQRVIERLDELQDEIIKGQTSRLDGKRGGIIITGDSDGAQHIIGTIANFYNALGITLPPYASLSVLSETQGKGKTPTPEELIETYEKDYAATAKKMIEQLIQSLEEKS